MKVLTLSLLFKTTLSCLVLTLLFLLNNLYEEKQRNTDLYGQVLSVHEDVIDLTVERQVCRNKVGRVEMPLEDRVSFLTQTDPSDWRLFAGESVGGNQSVAGECEAGPVSGVSGAVRLETIHHKYDILYQPREKGVP